jgi:hypothetical protein
MSATLIALPPARPTLKPGFRLTAEWLVLGLALLLRVAVVLSVVLTDAPRWFFSRGLEMGWLAQSMLDGLGLSSPFGVPTGPTAFIAPGYPLIVAAAFRLCGSYTVRAALALMALNIAANLLTVWLAMRLGSRLFGRSAGLAAGLIWASALPLWWMPTIFWETSLSACMLLGAIAFAVEGRPSNGLRWCLFGAACALGGLINPALLPVLIAVVCWKAVVADGSWPRRLGNLSLAALALALVFAPWPIRNARAFHAFIPLRTTVGFELWMGNRPGADGFLNEAIFPAEDKHELAEYRRLGEVAYTQGKQTEALAAIRHNPARFVQLTGIRTWRFWSGNGNKGGSPLYAAHALFTTVFGLAGLWLLARRRGWRLTGLFALPLLLFPLPYCITHAEFRYRLVLDPLLTVLAGAAVVALWQLCVRDRATKPASCEAVP